MAALTVMGFVWRRSKIKMSLFNCGQLLIELVDQHNNGIVVGLSGRSPVSAVHGCLDTFGICICKERRQIGASS